MSLLQVAREHADNPELAVSDLRQERLACGVADGDLDTVVARSRKESPDVYLVPGAIASMTSLSMMSAAC